ncbi:YbaB/EbfC family nucleoid-associated protein [Amycolatopsis magusensis]|uniref:YbaB/EbfC family nucleoid-associated protein n=1 Tax=Amycolatopsis magusensis TaxID=882444 RepID=UPI0024A987C6|nr:YbaB/EbfC family nucleoid-associated protein [Amycolatopsis magusensis]MDI5978516.1 YbaB/EbfC family nucleoid-associated protein [Amycolatopsis magusensis]
MGEAEARLDATIKAFEEQAAKAGELQQKIGELRGSARNADGSVTVTVAPSGAVLGLQLAPHAMRKSHTQLQQEILGAIRQATQQAAAQLEQTVQPILGEQAEKVQGGVQRPRRAAARAQRPATAGDAGRAAPAGPPAIGATPEPATGRRRRRRGFRRADLEVTGVR